MPGSPLRRLNAPARSIGPAQSKVQFSADLNITGATRTGDGAERRLVDRRIGIAEIRAVK